MRSRCSNGRDASADSCARRIFDAALWREDQPLRVVLIGTDFEVRVWEKLLSVPMGKLTTYSDLAARAGAPKAARAVGAAVGGFVTPASPLDVVLTQGRDANLKAVTILQDLRILGVDQVSDQNHDHPDVARTVTVEVTPQQGQILALAQQAGTLSLTLRSASNTSSDTPIASIRLNDVLRDSSPVIPRADVLDRPEESALYSVRTSKADSSRSLP